MKSRTLLLVVLGLLIFAFITVSEIKEPLEKLASLPKCENNNVILTSDLRSDVINYASSYISSGTGESYFMNHFFFYRLDYSLEECTFVVRFQYTYDELHTPMSVTVRAVNSSNFQIVKTNTFVRPINILVSEEEALEVAEEQEVNYDYYNLEIDVDKQTILYKFYKETLTQGNLLVFEIDAQSKEVRAIERPKEITPIV